MIAMHQGSVIGFYRKQDVGNACSGLIAKSQASRQAAMT